MRPVRIIEKRMGKGAEGGNEYEAGCRRGGDVQSM